MIYMTAEQAAEFDLLDLDVTPRVAIVSQTTMANITAAALA